MYETDDCDETLSQFQCPELDVTTTLVPTSLPKNDTSIECEKDVENNILHDIPLLRNITSARNIRKFPGPAGILVGSISDITDNNRSHMELTSQEIGSSQNQLPLDVFDTRMWNTLKLNVETWFHENGGPCRVETIKSIKKQASEGTLVRQKAPMVLGFVQCIDRSIADPLITLRDSTGEIMCTLDREAWCAFSLYLRPEQTALAVWKPTVLTFGTAHKRHYLNITLANVHALYCTTSNVKTKNHQMPDGYERNEADEFTIIERVDKLSVHNIDLPINYSKQNNHKQEASTEEVTNYLEGLDADSFCEDF